VIRQRGALAKFDELRTQDLGTGLLSPRTAMSALTPRADMLSAGINVR
jgi:hypothetical protein